MEDVHQLHDRSASVSLASAQITNHNLMPSILYSGLVPIVGGKFQTRLVVGRQTPLTEHDVKFQIYWTWLSSQT